MEKTCNTIKKKNRTEDCARKGSKKSRNQHNQKDTPNILDNVRGLIKRTVPKIKDLYLVI